MKFVPLPALEELNAVLCGVEAQGLFLTIRVEAFSTRKSREEKTIEQTLTQRQGSSTSAMHSPDPSTSAMAFGDVLVSPGPGSQIASFSSSSNNAISSGGGGGGSVDERLVLLISALNAIHGQCDYDFSVLSEGDFNICDPQEVFNAINANLEAVAGQPFGDGSDFWKTIADALMQDGVGAGAANSGTGSGGSSTFDVLTNGSCEYFQFCSPECDPLTQSTIWSAHYFILCKRQRLILSIMAYGEGNTYRGDDPQPYVSNTQSPNATGVGAFPSDPDDGRPSWYSTSKNRDFYGF